MQISAIRLEILKKFGSQERFSFAAGIDETIVSKIVRGVRRPTEHQRQVFEQLLETPAKQLFGEINEQRS
jgi:hypothetical protein